LGRRDDDRLRPRQQLAERDRDIARPGRHVDEEHVELSPVDVGEELLERAVQHRAAPHHRLVVVEEEPDRHQLQVMLHGRHDHPVDDDRLLVNAEDVWDRVAVDVRVEDADTLADLCERRREIRRQRRLADTALAAADGDHASRRVQRQSLRPLVQAATQLLRQRGALLLCHDVERQRHALDTRDVAHHIANLVLKRRAQRAAGDGERDCYLDATAVDDDPAHHVELGHRLPELGVDDSRKRVEDAFAAGFHGAGTERSKGQVRLRSLVDLLRELRDVLGDLLVRRR
jgi:hypothetical protein